MSAPNDMELSLTRAIGRHYRKNRALRICDIRAALKRIDRMLLTMLSEAEPRKWRQ